MKKIRNRIEAIINGKTAAPWLLDRFLCGFSMAYEGVVRLRSTLYERGQFVRQKLPCRVVSIGNISVGGTGKTPMAIYVSRLIRDLGYRVCVVSRGYRGGAEKCGGVVSDGSRLLMPVASAGDEPYMMAQNLKGIPVLVGKNRFQSGMTAIDQFNAQVIVLDDGFQHLSLFRDVDLVLMDDAAPLGNGRLLPAGRLREPVTALARGHAIIFTRSGNPQQGEPRKPDTLETFIDGRPVFHAAHQPGIRQIIHPQEDRIRGAAATASRQGRAGRRVFAFSALASNENFYTTLSDMDFQMVGHCGFEDHYQYEKKDLADICRGAVATGAACIATTEKDFVKIPKDHGWPMDLVVVGIEIDFGKETDAFAAFINSVL